MTSSNENDSSPVVNPSVTPSNADAAPSNPDGQKSEGGERGERRPRRQGAGGSKHPFNKKRPFNKDRPRREGGDANGPREGGNNQGNNQSSKLAPNPAESEALFASVVSGEFDAALDAPEVEELKNPDGVNENEVSHQTGAERRAQRAQRSREDEDSDAPTDEEMSSLQFANVDDLPLSLRDEVWSDLDGLDDDADDEDTVKHIAYLVSQSTLQESAHLSLIERA